MSSKEFDFMIKLMLTLLRDKKYDDLEKLMQEAIDKSDK